MPHTSDSSENSFLKSLKSPSSNRLYITILLVAVFLGSSAGYLMAQSQPRSSSGDVVLTDKPQTPQEDKRLCRDFATGKIEKRPAPKTANEYVEGTHYLIRDGATPVSLTSSVVDLTTYEGKAVTIYGETLKAIKEGWLMDVCRVEEK